MQRTKAGTFRKRRIDTLLGTIEKEYRVDFGRRPDMKLGTFLEEKGYSSLGKALKFAERISHN